MNHLSEEELTMHAYGDAENGARVAEHLAECAACAAEFARLEKVMAMMQRPVPERGEEYGEAVWRQVRAQLPDDEYPRRFWSLAEWLMTRRMVAAGAVAAVVLVAFLIGRYTGEKFPPQNPMTAQVKERIVLVAVGKHLDRSQMVLVELMHSEPEKNGKVNLAEEQEQARDLVDANRLYKQSAARMGDANVTGVLDDLERVLVEVANGPTEMNQAELARLQQEIQSQGILLKVRVLGAKVKQESKRPAANKKPQGRT